MQVPDVTSVVTPYRIDIRQGNYITQEMVAQLKPGMSRDQVRFILGTPLVADIFHADRWDYIYSFKPGRGELQHAALRRLLRGQQAGAGRRRRGRRRAGEAEAGGEAAAGAFPGHRDRAGSARRRRKKPRRATSKPKRPRSPTGGAGSENEVSIAGRPARPAVVNQEQNNEDRDRRQFRPHGAHAHRGRAQGRGHATGRGAGRRPTAPTSARMPANWSAPPAAPRSAPTSMPRWLASIA
jgi:outer membrane protein assembly factor BamE